MFKKAETINTEKISTLIGQGSKFEGVLNATGTIRIDGELKGDIFLKGDLIIGENGKVFGNITANSILNSGMIQGNVTAANQLKISSNGKVIGDIQVASLIVEEKSLFDGNCKMKKETEVHKEKKTA